MNFFACFRMESSRYVTARFTQLCGQRIQTKFLLIMLVEPEHDLAGDPLAVARLAVAIVGQHREQADQQAGDALAVHRRFIAAKQMVDMVVTVG